MNPEKTNLGYLGNAYQFKLIYNLIWFPKFAKHILPYLSGSYFSDFNHKKLYVLIKNYYDKYNSVPDRQKIEQLIQLNVESEMDQEMLNEIVRRLVQLSKSIISGESENDSQHIQDIAESFVQQQKLQHVTTQLQNAVDSGDLQKAHQAQEMLSEAFRVTEKRSQGARMGKFNKNIVKKQYFDAIPTGVPQLDAVIGGLPRGKIGMFVAGQGVGKSSFLTLVANNAYLAGKRVLHIVFDENEVEEVERLHTARWAGIETKHFPRYKEYVERKYREVHENYDTGELVIERLSSDGTTVAKLRSFILTKQQELGFEFDLIVIDYIEELSSIRSYNQDHEAQAEVMRSLKSMVVDLNIACWTATQGTKNVNDEKWVMFKDIGGSVMKIKKSQLIVSGGVDITQRKSSQVNFSLLKCNYAPSGHQWEGCYFRRSILDLQFSEVSSYVDIETIKQGYDEDDEHEMILKLMTEEERSNIPKIDEELALDDVDAPAFVPLAPKRNMVAVTRENRQYEQQQEKKTLDTQKLEDLKGMIDDLDFNDL